MKLKVILFLWVLCAQLINSQSLTELYKNDLPEIVFENEEFISTVEQNLQYYTSFSPRLAGYYIEHFKKKFVEKISDNDSNYYNQLQTLRDSLLIIRNAWAEDQLTKLSAKDLNRLHENLVSDIIDDYLVDEFFQTKVTTVFFNNDQKLKYIYYKYLASNPHLKFSQTENYDKLIEAESKRIVAKLDSLYSQNVIIDLDEVSQYAVKNRFLFSDSYLDFQFPNSNYSLIDFLVKIFKPKVQQKEGIIVKISGGYFNNIEGDGEYVINEINGRTHARFNELKTNLFPTVNIGAGYKFKLKHEKVILSYLSFEADFMLFSKFENKTEGYNNASSPYFIVDPNSIVAHNLIANYTIGNRKSESVSSFGALMLTPIYFFNTGFHVSAGLSYTYIKLSYEYDISRRDELGINGRTSDIVNYDITKKYEFLKHRIGLVISAEINISDNLTVDFRYKTIADGMFGIKYQF